MFKKLFVIYLVALSTALFLTACSTNEPVKNPKDENVLVYDKQLDNGVQLQIYRIAEGTITKEQAAVMASSKEGDPIVAVRYVLTNKSDKPVDIRNVTLWNGNFKNSSKGVGTFNFSDISLHASLDRPTLPQEFQHANLDKWMLEPGKSAQFAYDWVIDSKDMVMNNYIVFNGDKTIYPVEVDLSTKQ